MGSSRSSKSRGSSASRQRAQPTPAQHAASKKTLPGATSTQQRYGYQGAAAMAAVQAKAGGQEAADSQRTAAHPVQAKCDECRQEEQGAHAGASHTRNDPVQMDAVQMWNCRKSEYGKPSCVQAKMADEAQYQAKCEACDNATGPVQQKNRQTPADDNQRRVRQAAQEGLRGANQALPHASRIQAAFGHHDLSGVRVAIAGPAARAAEKMGALAYTSGNRIAFRDSPDLRLTAHEAAHTVQQKAGIHIPGKIGEPDDRWEQQADRVADAVVAGKSAEPILDELGVSAGSAEKSHDDSIAVQMRLTPSPTHVVEEQIASTGASLGIAPPAQEASNTAPAAAETEAPSAETEMDSPEASVAPAGEPPNEAESAQEAPPAAEPETPSGGGLGTCYRAGSKPPPDDTPEPQQDESSTRPEAKNAVSFGKWEDADDLSECEVGEALQQASEQIPGQIVEGEPGGVATNEEPGSADSAPASAAAQRMVGGAVEVPDSSAFKTVETQRDDAVADYQDSRRQLRALAPRSARLTRGLGFKRRPENGSQEVAQQQALTQLTAFTLGAGGQMHTAVDFAAKAIPAQLAASAAASLARIGAAIDSEKGRISARIASARATAFANAQAAAGQILQRYEANVAAVNAQTEAAISALNAEYDLSTQALSQREESALNDINQRFATGRQAHVDKGKTYSDRAIARGKVHVDNYETCKVNDDGVSYGDDGFWDGCLSVRRARAQQDAACKTTQGFSDNMQRMAEEKGFNLRAKRTQYRCAVISGKGQIQTTLDSTRDRLLEGLESGRSGMIAALAQARDMNVRGVDGALSATLINLDRQEFAQRQAVNDSGYVQQVAIEQMAHAAASSLGLGVVSAMLSLEQTLAGMIEQLTKGDVPDIEALSTVLAKAEQGLAGGIDALLSKMAEGTQASQAQIDDGSAKAIEALADISATNAQMATDADLRFSDQMTTLVASANAAMTQLSTAHSQRTQETLAEGITSMQEMVTGFDEAITQIATAVDEALAKSMEALETDLNSMAQKMDAKIISEAWKAAKKEQPAWKGVVAVVLIILIVIASVVISVLTLGAGAPFLAVVLVGAVVGAITAGLIQVINNWASGEDWDKGLVQAMVMGAVGGALGGAIGAGANGLAQAAVQGAIRAGASTAARAAINLGINFAGDMIAEGATQGFGYLAFGQKFNWQGFVMAGGMSVATTARGGVAGSPRGADVNAPAPSTSRLARGAMIDTGIGVGLAASVEVADWAMGGNFDFTRFASSAAAGAAGARAAARGARGGPRPPEPPATSRLGRLRQGIARARDATFSRLEISDTSRVSQAVSGRLAATEDFFAAGAGGLLKPRAEVDATRATPSTTPASATPANAPRKTEAPDVENPARTREVTRMDGASDLAAPGASAPIKLGDGSHGVSAKRTSTGDVVLTACSNCVILRDRLKVLADNLPDGDAKIRAQALADEASALQVRINEKKVNDIAGETRALAARINDAIGLHPDFAWALHHYLEGIPFNKGAPTAPEAGGKIDASTRQEFDTATGGTGKAGWFELENALSPRAKKNPQLNLDRAWEWYQQALTTDKVPALGEFKAVKTAVADRVEQRAQAADTKPPELYRLDVPQSEWQLQVNDAWVMGHIERGSVFEVVSNPLAASKMETRLDRGRGDRVQSVFGRELQLLELHGYRFVQDHPPSLSTRGIKGKMVPPSQVETLAAQGYTWVPHQTLEGRFDGVTGRWVKLPDGGTSETSGSGTVPKSADPANTSGKRVQTTRDVDAPDKQTIASAKSGRFVELLPESHLSRKQLAIHQQLTKSGDIVQLRKRAVSMADLREIGRVTGDEYNMFTLKGKRTIIRGYGNEIRVSEAVYQQLINGEFGKWSGHTHPPGYSLTPGPADRPFLTSMNQQKSAIWGDDGYKIFGRLPSDDAIIQSEIMRKLWQKIYGN